MKNIILPVLMLMFPVYVGALDKPRSPEEENLSDKEYRDKRVYDSVVGSLTGQDFSLYKLNYAILNDEDLILQYSFKYRVIEELYLTYTNFIQWDIYHDELPAEDNNFIPEMFYRFMLEKDWLVSVDTGWYHRSNGSAGPGSRSWDRWFARANKAFKLGHMDLFWITGVYTDKQKSKYNQDINDYHGPWDMQFTLLNLLGNKYENQQVDLTFRLEPGDGWFNFNEGQKVVGVHYRLPWKAFRPSIFIQYFNGYGEIIRDYNVHREVLRAGLSFHY